jgi:DnaJ-class molecular chaperone
MAIITAQQVHDRNWVMCPRCDGGAIFTAQDRRAGAQCTYCDGKGEIPRYPVRKANVWAGYSPSCERLAGA